MYVPGILDGIVKEGLRCCLARVDSVHVGGQLQICLGGDTLTFKQEGTWSRSGGNMVMIRREHGHDQVGTWSRSGGNMVTIRREHGYNQEGTLPQSGGNMSRSGGSMIAIRREHGHDQEGA